MKGPPAAPEKLLAAPAISEPALVWNYSNGLLRWTPTERAASYRIEVCADADCRSLLQTAQINAEAAQHQVSPLPEGRHFWRVVAVSESGLDGYPSAAASVEITDPTPDLSGPMLALVPVSGFVLGTDGAVRLGPHATLRLEALDEQSGAERIEINRGQGWQALAMDSELKLDTLATGTRLRATDKLGNQWVQIVEEDAAD